MRYHPCWRKAIASSIVFHILFLGIAGWLARDFFIPLDPETYIELELLTDAAAAGSTSNDSSSAAQDAQQAAALQQAAPVMKSTSTVVASAAPKVVEVTDELAVVAVEASASQASSDHEQENTSSAAGTTGEGSANESGKGTAGNGSGGSGKAGNGSGNSSGATQVTRPSILSKVEPTYPEAARMAGIQGTVQVKIQILANGLPGEVTVNRSSGQDSLDEAAIEAVSQWRFIPAKNREGISIMCYTTMPIVFRLR